LKIIIARVGDDLFAAGSGADAEEIIMSAAEGLLDFSSPPVIISEASPSEVTQLTSTIMTADGDWVVWFTKTGTDPSGNPIYSTLGIAKAETKH